MTNKPKRKINTAAGPAAGYFFQLRYSLLRGLQLHPKHPTGVISLEIIDDVSFKVDGAAIDSQLKHSIDPNAKITKSSSAVWRTLAIWLDQIADATDDLRDFHLVTTATVPDDDPLHLLKPGSSDDDRRTALRTLEGLASSSTNVKTEKDRTNFLAADAGQRLSLIRRINVLDGTPDLGKVGADIEECIHYVCAANQKKQFREDLEGWWCGRVFDSWVQSNGAIIELEEIAAKVHFFKARYKPDELPLDVPDEECGDIMEGRGFIKQIRLVTPNERRAKNAQRAFLRSGAQRSKWVRELRIDPEELNNFDHHLCERWEAESARVIDELEDSATTEEVKKLGKQLLGWAETNEVPFKNVRSTYLSSGSYHALADSMRVGWHPHYKNLLSEDDTL
jgi:hypothetical protein